VDISLLQKLFPKVDTKSPILTVILVFGSWSLPAAAE